MIRKIKFDSYPEPLSAVCLGCGRLGGDYDEERSFALLDRYYAMGGRFLDTANCYGRWTGSGLNESERCIGRWLKARQVTDMVVTSKCCHYAFDAHDKSRVDRESAMADLEDSRRALGLDTIPIYLTHRDNPSVDIRVIVDFLAEMVRSGKVLRFGLSNYRADRVRGALDYLGDDWRELMVGVSNEWSLHEECLAADAGGELEGHDGMVRTGLALRALHREKNLPLFAFSSTAGGYYAKIQNRLRTGDGVKIGKSDAQVLRKLNALSEKTGAAPVPISLAYLLRAGIPAVPISAVSSEKQMEDFETVSAWEDDLSDLSPLAKI